jgi:hypothetical protein
LNGVGTRAQASLPAIPKQGRNFFNDNLRVHAQFMHHLNRTLNGVARAMLVLPDKGRAVESLRSAQQSTSAMREVLCEAEHGSFTRWYDGDRLFGLDRLTQRIDRAIVDLGKP